VFCVLCFVFCVLCFVFCVLCFVFCVLCFVFCVLCYVCVKIDKKKKNTARERVSWIKLSYLQCWHKFDEFRKNLSIVRSFLNCEFIGFQIYFEKEKEIREKRRKGEKEKRKEKEEEKKEEEKKRRREEEKKRRERRKEGKG